MIEVIEYDPANLWQTQIALFMRHDLYCSSAEYDRFNEKFDSAQVYIDYLARLVSAWPGSVFFLKDDGNLVAHAILDGSNAHRSGEAYIDVIYVAFHARRRGYGAVLLNRCQAIAKQAGYRKAWLGTLTQRNSTKEFYASQGWSNVGIHPAKPHLTIWEKNLA